MDAGFGPPFKYGSYLRYQFPLISPLSAQQLVVTSPWGTRSGGQHDGVDLRARSGTPVVAAAGGVVKSTSTGGSCGYGVTLDHGNGFESRYCHMSRTLVRKGQRVRAGATLGASGGIPGTVGAGSSGGQHLHFSIYRYGTSVDPVPLVDWYPFALDYSSSVALTRRPSGYAPLTALAWAKAKRISRTMAVVSAVGAAGFFAFDRYKKRGKRRGRKR
jgi:murein DD-endopeptidase MepM/ murein hydrolase activator NlpD